MWSSPRVVTAPTDEPITLEAAKSFLRVDGDDLDAEIGRYAAGARGLIESMTSTRIMPQTVELSASSFSDLAWLPIGPVTSVVSISYRLGDGTSAEVDAASYELTGANIERGIVPAPGARWPTVANRSDAVTVRLEVGYGDAIPADLVLALYAALRGLAEGTEPLVEALVVNHRIWL